MKRSSIIDTIQTSLLQESRRSIRIVSSRFFLDIVGNRDEKASESDEQGGGLLGGLLQRISRYFGGWWRTISFVLLITALFASVVFTIHGVVFFIKDILFFSEKPIVNHSGAIIPQRSCNREQVIFYFNTADMWVNTGIQLRKGDKIRISHSGSFHSDILDIYNNTTNNDKLTYPYYPQAKQYTDVDNCLYNTTNRKDLTFAERLKDYLGLDKTKSRQPYFGSVIWQINNENFVVDAHNSHVHQIEAQDAEKFIRIRDNGELFLSVNDIYLSDRVIESLSHTPSYSDSYILFGAERIYFLPENAERLKSLCDNYPEYRTMWFRDNMGSMLICIEIHRRVHITQWMTRWYRSTEEHISSALSQGGLYGAVCFIGALLWAAIRLAINAFIILCGSLIAISILFALLVLSHKGYKSLTRLVCRGGEK